MWHVTEILDEETESCYDILAMYRFPLKDRVHCISKAIFYTNVETKVRLCKEMLENDYDDVQMMIGVLFAIGSGMIFWMIS